MRVGYGRVSTVDQNPDAQRDALAAAGCDQVLIDKASGKPARRPELDKALLVAREGDQLVITKLDRLGRSLEHLIAIVISSRRRDEEGRPLSAIVLFVVLRGLGITQRLRLSAQLGQRGRVLNRAR